MQDSYNKVFGNKNKIMFVYSHPDDAEVYSGATIARLITDGKEVSVVKMTSGNKGSKDSKTTEAELSKLRESEDTNSMAHLGVKPENNVYLRISDGDIQDNLENIGKVVREIRRFKPDIIVTHNPENVIIRHSEGINWVNHRDHMTTGKVVTYATYPYSRDTLFYPEHFQEGLTSHTTTELLYVDYYNHQDEVFIDVTEFQEKAITALLNHKSQFSSEKAKETMNFMSPDENGRRFNRFRYCVID